MKFSGAFTINLLFTGKTCDRMNRERTKTIKNLHLYAYQMNINVHFSRPGSGGRTLWEVRPGLLMGGNGQTAFFCVSW